MVNSGIQLQTHALVQMVNIGIVIVVSVVQVVSIGIHPQILAHALQAKVGTDSLA